LKRTLGSPRRRTARFSSSDSPLFRRNVMCGVPL